MTISSKMVHQSFREDYVVYKVYYKEDLVYIGSGKWGRQFHGVSGVSHNYELNKLHFTDRDNVTVEVVLDGLTKEESVQEENMLIRFSILRVWVIT